MKIPIHRYWTLLHTYLRPLWPQMIVLGLLLALKITSRLVNPQIVRAFLDQAMAGAPMKPRTSSSGTRIGLHAGDLQIFRESR